MGSVEGKSSLETDVTTSSLPQSWTTVTPLSKCVAAILFITLPFVGFYLGVKYNQITNSSSSVVPPTGLIVQNTPTVVVTSSNCLVDLGVNPYLGIKYGNIQSKKSGWCNVTVPFSEQKGYSLDYPEKWSVKVVGVVAQNLVFNAKDESAQDRDLFVESLPTKLELKDSYKESLRYGGSEIPIVKSEEVVQSKEIKRVGDKECLVLITIVNNQTIKRYFTIWTQNDYNTLFVFEVKGESSDIDSETTKEITANVEGMISSISLY